VVQEPSSAPDSSFRTFWRFVHDLKARRPLPQVLEKEVFAKLSGSSRSALVSTLHALGLIDRERRPTAALRALVDDPSPERLRSALERTYPWMATIDLRTATRGQVDSQLRDMGVPTGRLARARAFALQAADVAGLDVGPHLRSDMARRGRAAQGVGGSSGHTRGRPAKPGPKRRASEEQRPPDLVMALIEMLPSEADGWSDEGVEEWLRVATATLPYAYRIVDRKRTAAGDVRIEKSG
jgi:hypothetical protein